MIIAFKLSMPNAGSWNGKWSGAGREYVVTRTFRSKESKEVAKSILEKSYFHYNFGDGWSAGVSVSRVDSREAARLRRNSAGFAGYDWMVESIIDRGEITIGDEGVEDVA